MGWRLTELVSVASTGVGDLLSIFSLHFGPLVFSFAIVNFEGFILVHLMVGCFVKIKKIK